ncbi:bifunctional diaminohydroxyphosphoribosylaminopyrimidine deaminase/5-amino-6-(5-phosphoribosylamino)uracil reductase RibD [Accumulibacter sp.]|uniref:bifunctional diaminohydroxyphosphoribosylaminopyrimidine deaminase/5-amino-6-(5-phosphoribosylamino)uracil reductase RibD n=1 Tax=Accumulibacter sp. TaxID=2053492 RepID=UPI0025D895C7|nr:bifunctional diaminohydroxyphosphoribosylaminopyrimidine deaminase/5-amino-6-(5-phosphoribosylamino)uracil reductase RibD [Accumulibacter sp.]MCM8625329.1 bifunctional diaminohydroxyphosphoribosylaminopyrimidine deaminase/5-amino-6-(5-phosphoribosylamino)uracil reductase RibD [Accumulibacter sp.]
MTGTFSAVDHRFMAHALHLAERGLYSTRPNPRVGCVIVNDGEIVGEGWHQRAGAEHAEINALRAAGQRSRHATAYVTLEPCSHHGRTPPCAEALLGAGITRVVAAMEDPNPLVAGSGLAMLSEAGVTAECGLLGVEAEELNVGFVARMTRARPWLRVKLAASLDGKTALDDGTSQWLTGPAARRDAHRWRARACAILTGIGTVRDDDPQLNVRGLEEELVGGLLQPLKVVVDSRLATPIDARLFGDGQVLIASAIDDPERRAALARRGAEVIVLPGPDGRVHLPSLLGELARRAVNEVHVEAGLRLSGALLEAGLVDELLLYLAPCLLGDAARGMFDLPPLDSLANRRALAIRDLRLLGPDLRLLARFSQPDRSRRPGSADPVRI